MIQPFLDPGMTVHGRKIGLKMDSKIALCLINIDERDYISPPKLSPGKLHVRFLVALGLSLVADMKIKTRIACN